MSTSLPLRKMNVSNLLSDPLVVFYVSSHFQLPHSSFGRDGYCRLGVSDNKARIIWKLIQKD